MISAFLTVLQGNFKESYMAAFYDYFNEQKYADAVKNVSYLFVLFVESGVRRILPVSTGRLHLPLHTSCSFQCEALE